MSPPFPVEALANSILHEAQERSLPVDPLKLQKLMYLAHGYFLGAYHIPLVDELFEAWPYGPVSRTIYSEFQKFGANKIPNNMFATKLETPDLDGDNADPEEYAPTIPHDDEKTQAVIDYILNTYGEKTGIYLSDLTHKIGSPWDRTIKNNAGIKKPTIDNKLIEEHFGQLVNHA